NIQQAEQLNDFAHAQPVHSVRAIKRLAIDEDQWAGRVRDLSALFTKYPDVKTSSVDFDVSEGGFHLVNSEGSEVREPESVADGRRRARRRRDAGRVRRPHRRTRAARFLRSSGRPDADRMARPPPLRQLQGGFRSRAGAAAQADRKGRAQKLPSYAAAGARL